MDKKRKCQSLLMETKSISRYSKLERETFSNLEPYIGQYTGVTQIVLVYF
jgi:hypothetical protein